MKCEDAVKEVVQFMSIVCNHAGYAFGSLGILGKVPHWLGTVT